MSDNIILKIENLSKTFKTPNAKIKAVNNINLQINKGECFGLVGESGSGKSTLSNLICMLEKADEGKIYFNSKDISTFSKTETKNFKRNCQIIFQDPYSSLNPKMKIKDIIEEPLLIHKIGKTKEERFKLVNEIRTLMALDLSVLEKYPCELSGGQRQRVAIASSIILKPQFLICDESVSSLDVLIQGQILNLLKSMQKNMKMTYLFISHNLNVVAYMADKIAVMKDGQIVEQGPTQTIIENPHHPFTKKLLCSCNG